MTDRYATMTEAFLGIPYAVVSHTLSETRSSRGFKSLDILRFRKQAIRHVCTSFDTLWVPTKLTGRAAAAVLSRETIAAR